MNVVMIFGTRSFQDYGLLCEKMNYYTSRLDGPCEVATGEWRGVGYGTPNYRGADLLGEQWAYQVRRCGVRRFPPPFADHPNTHAGRSAAFHARNREMVLYVAAAGGSAVGFWDGTSPGSRSVIDLLKKHRVQHRVVRY